MTTSCRWEELDTLVNMFRVQRDRAVLVDLCAEVVILVDGPIGPSLSGVQRIYDSFMRRSGQAVRLCARYDEGDMHPFDPEQWADVSDWLDAQLQYGSGSFGAHFQAGDTPIDATPPSLDIVHYAPSVETARVGIQMRLPLQELKDGADELRSYFLSLLEGLTLNYALCGLSVAWNAEQHDAARAFVRQIIPRLFNHPGVEMGDFPFLLTHAPAGLMSVNWLTALGPRVQARVGPLQPFGVAGQDAVDILVASAEALVLQAGPFPMAGDASRGDDLPAYRALAQSVRAAWASDNYIENISYSHMDPALGDRWVKRFFD